MLLVVGRIGRAHGVVGEATVEIRTDLPEERFAVGTRLTTDPASAGPLTITSARFHKGALLIKFDEVKDRTAVEKLRNVLLLADIDIAEESDGEDEFHVQQLIGCNVVTISGVKVGTLKDVINLPGQDLLAVDGIRGEVLIPFVHEIVPDIDLTKRVITISPPEGLLNLEEVE
jgi:16S rRNA processing protein RimM